MGFGRRTFLHGIPPAFAGLFLPGLLLAPADAEASTLRAVGLDELIRQSERVVEARVVARESRWETAPGKKRIVTVSRIVHDDEWIERGRSDGESLVVTWGGRVGDLAQKVLGEAELTEGESCVLFLGAETARGRRVIGMTQGHFGVDGARVDSDTSAPRSLRRRAPVALLAPTPRGAEPPAVERLDGLALDRARSLVRERAR